jgi:hypothetical protein
MQHCSRLRNLGQASPMRKHAMTVKTPSKAKIASLDQPFNLPCVSVGLAGIGSAEIWSVKERSGRKTA